MSLNPLGLNPGNPTSTKIQEDQKSTAAAAAATNGSKLHASRVCELEAFILQTPEGKTLRAKEIELKTLKERVDGEQRAVDQLAVGTDPNIRKGLNEKLAQTKALFETCNREHIKAECVVANMVRYLEEGMRDGDLAIQERAYRRLEREGEAKEFGSLFGAEFAKLPKLSQVLLGIYVEIEKETQKVLANLWELINKESNEKKKNEYREIYAVLLYRDGLEIAEGALRKYTILDMGAELGKKLKAEATSAFATPHAAAAAAAAPSVKPVAARRMVITAKIRDGKQRALEKFKEALYLGKTQKKMELQQANLEAHIKEGIQNPESALIKMNVAIAKREYMKARFDFRNEQANVHKMEAFFQEVEEGRIALSSFNEKALIKEESQLLDAMKQKRQRFKAIAGNPAHEPEFHTLRRDIIEIHTRWQSVHIKRVAVQIYSAK